MLYAIITLTLVSLTKWEKYFMFLIYFEFW